MVHMVRSGAGIHGPKPVGLGAERTGPGPEKIEIQDQTGLWSVNIRSIWYGEVSILDSRILDVAMINTADCILD